MKVEILQISQSTSEASFKNHKVLIDKPLSQNGSDNGATAEQLFLMSLGGDLMAHLLEDIQVEKIRASDIKVEVEALNFEKPARFTEVLLEFSANYEDKNSFKNCISTSLRKSIVLNTIGDVVKIQIKVR
jgi:uncharacterized OsmC-like protein